MLLFLTPLFLAIVHEHDDFYARHTPYTIGYGSRPVMLSKHSARVKTIHHGRPHNPS